jgi:alkyl hydroperoxide reductase subunit AhpC
VLSQLGCQVVRLSHDDNLSEAAWAKTEVPLISEHEWVRYTLSPNAVVSWG